MRFVVQRVCEARVSVEDQVIGQIGHGLLVLVGVADSDDKQIADKMIDKLTKLRIFADCRKGNRPSFTLAGKPDKANELYEYCICEIEKKGFRAEHGSFGAEMKVSLLNDGPFTIIFDETLL